MFGFSNSLLLFYGSMAHWLPPNTLIHQVLLAAPKPIDISAVKELQGHSDQHPTAKGEHMARWKRLFLSTAATSHFCISEPLNAIYRL